MKLGTFLHIFCATSLEGRPIITSPEDFNSHRPSARMIVTYPLVDFLEDIFDLVLSDALQKWRRVAPSVQILVDQDVP